MKNKADLPTHSFEIPSGFPPPFRKNSKRYPYALFFAFLFILEFSLYSRFSSYAAFPPVCGPRGFSIN
jgi:hypothetical protein